jgi:hypothetical protein
LSAKQTFTFILPQGQGAVLDSTAVQPPGTLPSLLRASACGARDQYCIAYPMRPGSTKIRVLYHLPYTGNISITQPLLHPVGEVALVVPESLHFEASYPGVFWNRGTQNGSSRYVAVNMRSGQSLTFSLSGANVALRQTPAKTATLNTAGLPQPVPQSAFPSPANRVLPLAILIGAFLGAAFMVRLAFHRTVRPSV